MKTFGRRVWTLARMPYRSGPRQFVLSILISLTVRLVPLAGALAAKLTVGAALDDRPVATAVWGTALGVAVAFTFVLARLSLRTSMVVVTRTSALYDREIVRLTTDAPGIEHYENPQFLARIERLRHQPMTLGLNGSVVYHVVYGALQMLVILLLLMSVSWWLVLLPAVAMASLFVVSWSSRRVEQAFAAGSPDRLIANEMFETATSPRRADEVRTLRLRRELIARHRAALDRADRRMRRAEHAATSARTVTSMVLFLAYGLALALVVDRGIRGAIPPEDVLLAVLVIGMMTQQITALLDSVRRVLWALALVDDFIWLEDHHAQSTVAASGVEPPASLRDGISFVDVSFRYASGESPAVEHLSLSLPPGTIVALVGENGAGKTTIGKLLTGMYQPTDGTITVDGVPLHDIDLACWRRRVTAAFQDFAKLEFTVQESVGVGNLAALDSAASVSEAIERVGAHGVVSSLHDGLGSRLGSSFDDGVDLSTGQWQKLALARGMMRDDPLLLLLDEPTASLDPLAEHDVFRRYVERSREISARTGAVTVLVTHRFANAWLADVIVVLDRGRIVESGSHRELLARDGHYAALFGMEASSYR